MSLQNRGPRPSSAVSPVAMAQPQVLYLQLQRQQHFRVQQETRAGKGERQSGLEQELGQTL